MMTAVGGNGRWTALALLCLMRVSVAAQFQAVGAIGPLLVHALGVNYAVLGTLIGLYMVPGIVMALPGGMLANRLGARRAALLGLMLMGGGGLSMAASSWLPLVFAGRLISGAGAVLVNVSLTKMVADWFAGREIVTAMAIFVSSWSVGVALCLLVIPPLAGSYGWDSALQASGVMALLCGIILVLAYGEAPSAPQTKMSSLATSLTRRQLLLVSLAGAMWAIANAGYVIIANFSPDLFVSRGYSLVEAGWAVSLVGWIPILSTPIGGILSDRSRRPTAFIVGGFAAVALAAIAFPFVANPTIALIAMAIAAGLPAGPAMSLPVQVLRAENRATGMGIFYTWFYVGMGVFPAAAGLLRDITGSPVAPLLFTAGLMLGALACLAAFLVVSKRPQPFTLSSQRASP
jgi:predicted MFS family arabinose efflux permease